jgi:hypothetical protein
MIFFSSKDFHQKSCDILHEIYEGVGVKNLENREREKVLCNFWTVPYDWKETKEKIFVRQPNKNIVPHSFSKNLSEGCFKGRIKPQWPEGRCQVSWVLNL